MTPDALKRAALFVPCDTKEHLQRWIRFYLGLDLPSVTICDDDETTPPSNSNAMDLVWEIYSKARDGTDPKFQRVLVYAARDSFKTVCCSILEILCLFHLRRSVAHMAAIESQASKCASYIKKYLQRPILRDYVNGKNKRNIEITRYECVGRETLSQSQYDGLAQTNPEVASQYSMLSYYMQILIATMSGANSEHVPFLVLDELDLAPPGPVKEAFMIPSPGERGELPITLMVSSRKFSFGMVQKEIDAAEETDLVVRHWNIIDVTKACPPKRHLPDEPKIPIYYSEDLLKAVSADAFALIPDIDREKFHYRQAEGYSGCLKNCKLFSVCRGRLATKQTSNTPLLKSVDHVIGMFKTFAKDPEIAKAQLMCWKPSSVGLIYPYLSSVMHRLSAAKIAKELTGDDYPETFTKGELIQLMKSRNMAFHSGMDFGFTHNFAVVTGALDGHRIFIIDCLAIAGLEIAEKVDLCTRQIKHFDSMIYPDPAYPSDIKSFRKAGFRCKNFVKEVLTGINAVRSKLMPSLGADPEVYFLSGDEGVDFLFKRMSRYHWVLDAAGNPTDEPDKTDDDECDAIRYLFQNLFGQNARIMVSVGPNRPEDKPVDLLVAKPENKWMSDKIRELTDSSPSTAGAKVRKGGFVFDL